jgi:transcriptional regulator with XRE-family HTH domain
MKTATERCCAKMIRTLRLQKRLSQKDLEKKSGISRCYLSRLENGHLAPSLDTLSKIAVALDVSIAQFFTEDSPAARQKLYDADLHFMQKLQPFTAKLNQRDRASLLALVRRFAGSPLEAKQPAVPCSLFPIPSSSPEAQP